MFLSDSERNRQVEAIASMMTADGVSPDETDPARLGKYRDHARSEFGLGDELAGQLVFESLVYLKLRDGDGADMDPLSDGEKFGVGFS